MVSHDSKERGGGVSSKRHNEVNFAASDAIS